MIRSKPLSRKAPLRRMRMKRAGAPRRVTRPGPGRDEAYLEAVRKLPCCAPRLAVVSLADLLLDDPVTCLGVIHAHHAGHKPGMALKAPDNTAIALCSKHHMQFHDANGVFAGWTKADRRRWADAAIEDTQRLVAGTQTQGESR